MQTKQPFLIGHIAAFLRWWELLIFTISAPVLTFATLIAVVDLLTGERLLAQLPNLLFAFGVALAVGIDSQLPAAFERVRDAIENKRWLSLILWTIIGLWTGLVVFTALRAFSIEQAQHVSESQALRMIGVDPDLFASQRDLLAVVLSALSGFARVHARPVDRKEERAHLEKELELEPLRQRLEAVKAQRAVQVVHAGKAVLAAARNAAAPTAPATPAETPEPDPEPPTPAGPSRKGKRRDIGRTVEETQALKRRAGPAVLAMSADGMPHREIAMRLSAGGEPITQFMVGQIIKEAKRETQEVA